MTLREGSWLYRWLFAHPGTLLCRLFWNKWDLMGEIPPQMSLCMVFWMAVIFSPLMWAIGIVVLAIGSVIASVVLIIRALSIVMLTRQFRAWVSQRVQASAGLIEDSATVAVIGDLKRRVCPLIYIEPARRNNED